MFQGRNIWKRKKSHVSVYSGKDAPDLSGLKLCFSFNSSTFYLYSTAYLRLLAGKFLYDMKTIVDLVELPIHLTLTLCINAVLGKDLNILVVEDKLSTRNPQ